MRRVSVVGSTGTGKTTFARELARILGVPQVELDAVAWGPNGKLADAEARVRDAIAPGAGVADSGISR